MAERSSQSLWGYQALVSLPTVAADPFRELVRRALLAVGIVLVNTFRWRVQKDGAFNSAKRIVSKVLIGRAEGACMPAAPCPDQTMGRDNPLVRGRFPH